jgi:formate transporter
MGRIFPLDAYEPEQIARRVESEGAKKATLPVWPTLMLGGVGGGLIGLGAMFHTVITSDPELGAGAGRILGGIFFAMGYLLAISAGAQVFTTNNLVVMSWAARKISTAQLLRNWGLVLVGNAAGAVALAVAVVLSGHPEIHAGEVGRAAVGIAVEKAEEGFADAFFKGVLGNVLIAMGVWLAMAGRSLTDRLLGPLLPIAALPIAGFEHSVGNLYYLSAGWINAAMADDGAAVIGWWGVVRNLLAVGLGNVVGGGGLVALVYHVIYRRLIPRHFQRRPGRGGRRSGR